MQTLIYAVIAVLVHECGHAAAALLLGMRVKRIVLSRQGIGVMLEAGVPIQNVVVALAGPLASLIAAITWPEMRLSNEVLFAVNLLPIWNLDGKQALRAIASFTSPISHLAVG